MLLVVRMLAWLVLACLQLKLEAATTTTCCQENPVSLYTDIRDGVFLWTNRPNLVNETDAAIRQALRTAHRSGSFYRDLQTVAITGLPQDRIQVIDLATATPNFRNLAYVKPTDVLDAYYEEATVRDLLDQDGYAKENVFWGVGNNLNIRAVVPVSDITICYYTYPLVTPIANINSWIAADHQDLVILWAAASIMAMLGEQEVKTRIEALAQNALRDLTEDATLLVRR